MVYKHAWNVIRSTKMLWEWSIKQNMKHFFVRRHFYIINNYYYDYISDSWESSLNPFRFSLKSCYNEKESKVRRREREKEGREKTSEMIKKACI